MKMPWIIVPFDPGESSFGSFIGTKFDSGFRHDFDDIQPIASEETSYAASFPKFFRGVYQRLTKMLDGLNWCSFFCCFYHSFLGTGLCNEIHFQTI